MVTRGPARRVAAILRSARPAVDEIVVAADAAGDPALEDLGGTLADQVAWFESPGTLESTLLWALRRCEADWILRVDDDEIPAPDLLVECRDERLDEVTHALVPRRWLYGNAGAWIASPPWGEDLQLRLVRNVPGLWRQGVRPHDPLEVLGPHRVLRAPIYHGNLLVRGVDERQAKAADYEARASGVFCEDLPTNALFFPETFTGITTDRVDPGHLEAAAALAIAHDEDAPAPARPRRRVTPAEELLAYTSAAPLGERAHSGRVRFPRPPRALPAGSPVQTVLDVENTSSLTWPGERGAGSPVRLAPQWDDGRPTPRVLLPAPLAPGTVERLRLLLQAPDRPGRYRLTVGLVHEHVAWFGEPAILDVDVVPPNPADGPFVARPGPA
jgi:hypothetical protein